MLGLYPKSFAKLVKEFSKLPSIGEKSAIRLAYHVIQNDKALSPSLAEALKQASELIGNCKQCFFMSETDLCTVCSNPSRDETLLCVIEKPMDMVAIERVGEYRGRYHVLHGVWAPLRGQGPDSMKLKELMNRLDEGKVKEVILALSSTLEGDATAMYVSRLIQERGLKTSRLAQGMPKGGELEYADEVTLSRAFAGRVKM